MAGVKPVEPMARREVKVLADAKVHACDLLDLIVATMDASHITVVTETCPGFVRSTAPPAPAVVGVPGGFVWIRVRTARDGPTAASAYKHPTTT
ncbi:hypothetical protein GCM10022420_088060 [Streptomyces iranensis]